MTTSLMAYEIRTEFGWLLNPDSDYSNPRLKEIAQEMDTLNERWNLLDKEIKEIRIKEFGPIIEDL